MRICLVYDCLFPHTVGGAERWYRNLAERLAADGHDVTYVTLRQWNRGADPGLPGVRVHSVGPRMGLYDRGGRRRIAPPIVFGLGVFCHLVRRGHDYDVVHTASFPYFSLLAAGATRRRAGFRLVVDWHEVWTSAYWTEYLGAVGGQIGLAVQCRCARIRQRAFCFSQLHARRLEAAGLRGSVTVLAGEYAGPELDGAPDPAEPVVVFAGRHIPEKRPAAIVPAVAKAAKEVPGLRGIIFGDGPERGHVLAAIRAAGADGIIEAPGFVSSDEVDAALRRALCLVLPSRREGYGLIVVEASALGVPSIVVREPDNAAVELIAEAENGFVVDSANPEDLAAAILRVSRAGAALRQSTADWYRRNAIRLSLTASLDRVVDTYASGSSTC
jgi:glycosyltransferase involved in cell wall biosynthesis